MTKLTEMRNIGKEFERKLNSVGIYSAEELRQVGSKEAYVRLKIRYPNVCLVHLYVLWGAIGDIQYNRLPEEIRRDLKRFADSLK